MFGYPPNYFEICHTSTRVLSTTKVPNGTICDTSHYTYVTKASGYYQNWHNLLYISLRIRSERLRFDSYQNWQNLLYFSLRIHNEKLTKG